MESYDGHLYRDQEATRRLLALIEQAMKDNDALLVLACAGELIDRVGDAYFLHDGGRTAQLEVAEFLRGLRNELAPTDSERERGLLETLEKAAAGDNQGQAEPS